MAKTFAAELRASPSRCFRFDNYVCNEKGQVFNLPIRVADAIPYGLVTFFAHRNHRSLLRPFSQFQGQRFAGPIVVHNPEHFYFHLLSGTEFLLQQSGKVG